MNDKPMYKPHRFVNSYKGLDDYLEKEKTIARLNEEITALKRKNDTIVRLANLAIKNSSDNTEQKSPDTTITSKELIDRANAIKELWKEAKQ